MRPHGARSSYWNVRSSLAHEWKEPLPPRNDFSLADDAAEHVLLAGGISITALLAMARWLERRVWVTFFIRSSP